MVVGCLGVELHGERFLALSHFVSSSICISAMVLVVVVLVIVELRFDSGIERAVGVGV